MQAVASINWKVNISVFLGYKSLSMVWKLNSMQHVYMIVYVIYMYIWYPNVYLYICIFVLNAIWGGGKNIFMIFHVYSNFKICWKLLLKLKFHGLHDIFKINHAVLRYFLKWNYQPDFEPILWKQCVLFFHKVFIYIIFFLVV